MEGVLTPGREVPGRGAYTCLDVACFHRALERRGFARTLRQAVGVDGELARLYTEGSNG